MTDRITHSKILRQPAEWAPHQAVWTAFPYDPDAWLGELEEAKTEFVELCRALSTHGGERLEILVNDETVKEEAARRLHGLNVRLHLVPYGDSWLRDTAPVFVRDRYGGLVSTCFKFNGWGGKYVMAGDDRVARTIAASLPYPAVEVPIVFEGGSLDVDGAGTGLTTRQCLLNPNRNPDVDEAVIEAKIKQAYGLTQLIWLDDGLLNDHTDGHIDNIARFVAPGKVVCMSPTSPHDPNADVLNRIIATLRASTDAQGKPIQVVTVPSVGRHVDDEGKVMPASYMNFYVANGAVVIPVYGGPHDAEAVRLIGEQFPGRRAIGLPARAILTGGGSFHCITQQQPVDREEPA